MLSLAIPVRASERRLKIRYPMRLAVCYRSGGSSASITGVGYTVNMSSSGLLFECLQELETGMKMSVTLEWPWLLDSVTPLQLVTLGKIVRAEGSTYGMAFATHQFRTMKRKQFSLSSEPVAYTSNYCPRG